MKKAADAATKSGTRTFWDGKGSDIPAFYDAVSTKYYFECERTLFKRYFPGLRGKRVFKTDLWDEAKNSRILEWAARQGAEAWAIDISPSIAGEARAAFLRGGLVHKFAVSDVRSIAFKDGHFDYLYSMGTVEHTPEYRRAIRECYRVLRQGGTAIIGVPNLCDPFLRPAMVSILNRLGLYAYGYEKSFSRRKLDKLLRETGFEVLARTGILFMPGWLRMLDLFFHVNGYGLRERLFRPVVSFFAFLYRKFSFLRRHGYLIACVVRKP